MVEGHPRSALVTGASGGIGYSVAEMLSAEGYGLTLVARDGSRLEEAASRLRAGGGRVDVVVADVGEAGSPRRAVESHRESFGGLDLVLSNAGGSRRSAAAATTPESLRRLFSVHVEAAFGLASAALPLMRRGPGQAPSWFIVTASVAAVVPTPGFAAYSAAKAALVSLARSVNLEESANGVRACALCPGFVDTALTAPLHGDVPPSTMLSGQDVAGAVRYLLSLSANAVVNQIIIERAGAAPLSP